MRALESKLQFELSLHFDSDAVTLKCRRERVFRLYVRDFVARADGESGNSFPCVLLTLRASFFSVCFERGERIYKAFPADLYIFCFARCFEYVVI